jgi:hypothetical protein
MRDSSAVVPQVGLNLATIPEVAVLETNLVMLLQYKYYSS